MNDNQPLGVVYDMPNSEYHSSIAMSSTGFKEFDRSPLHFYAARVDPNREPDQKTPAKRRGTAWHCATFEPERFDETYIVMPDGLDRRTKEGKQLWSEIEADGREPIKASEKETWLAMRDASRSHPVSKLIFGLPEIHCEASIFWIDQETGVPCRIRPDLMAPPCEMFPLGMICDGKTTKDVSPSEFARFVWNWDSYYQAAFYADGFQQAFGTDAPPPFIWLAQETDRPFATAYYSAGDDLVKYGRKKYRQHLRTYAALMDRYGIETPWPGYPTNVVDVAMPAFAAQQIEAVNAA
jgi:hypothetical protein